MATGSPAGAREEQFLEKLFPLISHFAYDKAKEMIEKEKETVKPSGGAVFGSSSSMFGSSSGLGASPWALFVHCMAQLLAAEKAYMSLGFLEPKGIIFHRQKDLKTLYVNLATDVKKVEDSNDQLLAHLSVHLCHYLTARLKAMDFYIQLSTIGSNKAMTLSDLVNVITDIAQSCSKSFHHPLLSSLKAAFGFEIDTVQHLLQTQSLMSEWKFLPSLMQLYEAHTKLTTWGASAQLKETKKSTFGGSSKHSGWPALYLWLSKYKAFLLSKFSVYFYDVLQKQTTPNEMKTLIAKAPEDFVAKLVHFHRKSDAHYVALVLDVQGLGDAYTGPGYSLPNKTPVKPQGLDSFPTIFSYPQMERPPASHWANVVSLITNRSHDNKVLCVHDKRANSTYFLSQVEEKITLVVIFDTKKSEKDSYINNFMTEMSTNLKGTKLFSQLKPGIKG